MTRYVLGFCFDDHRESVMLKRGSNGLFNGIIGLALNDLETTAMARVFRGATGYDVNWESVFTNDHGENYTVVCRAFDTQAAVMGASADDASLRQITADFAHEIYHPALRWIIPLLLDDSVQSGTLRVRP